MQRGHTVFQNCRLATMASASSPLGLVDDQWLLVRDGTIEAFLPANRQTPLPAGTSIVDGQGGLLTPGLIDCHTHLVFAGDRSGEFVQRCQGASYESIAGQGGGILATVRATRAASYEALQHTALRRARHWLEQGVTTIEIKSGYGLDLATERKQLMVARSIANELPLDVRPTLLAAHAVPPEYHGDADAYVDFVCEQMIPALADLANAVDVFCESMAFSVAQSRRVLQTGIAHGLAATIHAEQRSRLGGAAMAAALGAQSADHLEYLADEDVAELRRGGTVATLLPGAFYFLGESQRPPVNALRSAEVPMAVATDFNPGSSPLGSPCWAMNLACLKFGLTVEEALLGMTRHAAMALGKDHEIGSLAAGKQADLVLWRVSSPAALVCALAENPCRAVYKRGRLVHEAAH